MEASLRPSLIVEVQNLIVRKWQGVRHSKPDLFCRGRIRVTMGWGGTFDQLAEYLAKA